MTDVTTKTAGWRANAEQAKDITLDALLRRAAHVFADRTAITWEHGQCSYNELAGRSWQLANALRDKGHERGATIALLSEPRPEYAECYMAMAALGVTVAT